MTPKTDIQRLVQIRSTDQEFEKLKLKLDNTFEYSDNKTEFLIFLEEFILDYNKD